MPDAIQPFVERVRLRNYRSIGECDVTLRPLSILVGPNAAGKSNFVDALRLTVEALHTTLDTALRERNGAHDIRRRSKSKPTQFTVTLDLCLRTGARAEFSYSIDSTNEGGFSVAREYCEIKPPDEAAFSYRIDHDVFEWNVGEPAPRRAPDQLFLQRISSVPPFSDLFDEFTSASFHSFNPEVLRDVQQPDPGQRLMREGLNLASVIHRAERVQPAALERLTEYLQQLAPGITSVRRKAVGSSKETLEFQQATGAAHMARFEASSMSDGTLRGLAVLAALVLPGEPPTPLTVIEEPEIAVHPAALSVLMDAVHEASTQRQVLLTSHSADLLDDEALGDDEILAVANIRGATVIGPLAAPSRDAIRERLFTPGELLRMKRLEPKLPAAATAASQLQLGT